MLDQLKINRILFLDIETVPQNSDFDELDEDFKSLWEKKSQFMRERKGIDLEKSYENAGIYAEFGKIICISVGFFVGSEGEWNFRTKSFCDHDEKKLLEEFAQVVRKFHQTDYDRLCAHNGKEFDFPYIARRMVVHGMEIPYMLRTHGKKPWETNHLDTMELWKFGDYKHYTALHLLAKILDIPTPKDDIDGSQVRDVYYVENDLERIEKYCRKDTLTVAQVLLRFMRLPLVEEEHVQTV
jgi:DNA polymerase elongation subunit (family B)